MGDEPLTYGERETLERLRRLSERYVGGLVPLRALPRRRDDLERLLARKEVRRFQGTGPISRVEGVIHVYYAPAD
jgi:hypothetical protein